ncbi:hypothetical protein L596_003466 [Steinernema carpocapsae]|uniref:Uncharacterized protein n=1 Tax=Steinernema carpocapsae TaxID=34508 RepID=A0A4U8UVS0_STECR|nr:hypothetical protein L596_003466 [Steinernema carpocapsae]
MRVTVAAPFAFACISPSLRTGRFRNRDGIEIGVANATLTTVVSFWVQLGVSSVSKSRRRSTKFTEEFRLEVR